MEKGGTGQGNTKTPAANAASRKKENTPGSQRGGRGEEKQAACRKAPRSLGAESVRCQAVCADWLNNSRKQRCGPWRTQLVAASRIAIGYAILTINE